MFRNSCHFVGEHSLVGLVSTQHKLTDLAGKENCLLEVHRNDIKHKPNSDFGNTSCNSRESQSYIAGIANDLFRVKLDVTKKSQVIRKFLATCWTFICSNGSNIHVTVVFQSWVRQEHLITLVTTVLPQIYKCVIMIVEACDGVVSHFFLFEILG